MGTHKSYRTKLMEAETRRRDQNSVIQTKADFV
jgi:hypothetical protein